MTKSADAKRPTPEYRRGRTPRSLLWILHLCQPKSRSRQQCFSPAKAQLYGEAMRQTLRVEKSCIWGFPIGDLVRFVYGHDVLGFWETNTSACLRKQCRVGVGALCCIDEDMTESHGDRSIMMVALRPSHGQMPSNRLYPSMDILPQEVYLISGFLPMRWVQRDHQDVFLSMNKRYISWLGIKKF